MKNKLHKFTTYGLLLIAIACFALQACEKEEQDAEAPRSFRPTQLTATVTDVSVTFNWNAIPGIASYLVEVSMGDSLEFTNIIDRYVVTETTYTLDDLAGDTRYSVRVRSNSDDMEHDSYFAQIIFKVPRENVFNGFYPRLLGIGQVALRWTPGKAVTYLRFTPEGSDVATDYPVSLADVDAGMSVIEQVPNGAYRIEIYNGDISRGKTTVNIVGTQFLDANASLASAISGAANGAVIVLEAGAVFESGNPSLPAGISFTLYGADANEQPVISGKAFLPNEGSSIHCENITFDGGNDGVTAGTGVDYLCGGPTYSAPDVPKNMLGVSFENCYIRNYNRSIVRVQGDRIDQVRFNNCTFQNIGRNGQYSIIQTNATGKIENVTLANSTLRDIHGCVMYANGASEQLTSFTIQNCTFYDVFATNSQSILRSDNARSPATSSVTGIIVGKLKLNDGTVRLWNIGTVNAAPTTTANNYKTFGKEGSDGKADGDCWLHADYKMEVQEYTGTADDLFLDPANGDFRFKDRGFSGAANAGDPRWR
jgi:hypothetical protein